MHMLGLVWKILIFTGRDDPNLDHNPAAAFHGVQRGTFSIADHGHYPPCLPLPHLHATMRCRCIDNRAALPPLWDAEARAAIMRVVTSGNRT